MPKDLQDFPRPPSDNGRGLGGSASADWKGDDPGFDFWIGELKAMGIRWFKVIDDNGSSIPLCTKLIAAGIFPIVRILRRDPPPNDSPEPNPGHLGRGEEQTIQRLIALGVRYFETNNEPNRRIEWKQGAMPGTTLEAAKLVALNWLFDARFILEAGGFPGLPAIGSGGAMDLMGALVALNRHHILLDGCWIALHNDAQNRPLDFPENQVNHFGQPLAPDQYDLGLWSEWAWWNNSQERTESLAEVNALRDARKSPNQTIQQDHASFREFEFYNALANKYLGRSIPIISTDGGYRVGARQDPRYPRITPAMHSDLTVAMFDWTQRQAPDYYFASIGGWLVESPGKESDAWYGLFWRDAFQFGTDGYEGFPKLAVPNAGVDTPLPVVDAIKAMPNLPRRLPGTAPTPPVTLTPSKPPEKRIERPGLGHLFPDEREATPVAPVISTRIPPPPPIVEREAIAPPPPPEQHIEIPSPVFESSKPVAMPEPRIELDLPIIETSEPPSAPELNPIETSEPVSLVQVPASDQDDIADALEFMPRIPNPSEIEWDFRLDALNVTVEFARVEPGMPFWKLISAEYEGPGESGETHHIFYTVLDELNQPITKQRVWQGWSDNQTNAVTDEHGVASIPLWQSFSPSDGELGHYTAWVDNMPCDLVLGLGLPQKRHVNFRLTWRRART